MNIPLINSNSKQDINTSLIAIRNAINELARMKESESVEDLQRQVNIINQQIANFNSEFSAINTHLNTIDTNILNLQPVDTVASGNLHSVTSNAVFNELHPTTVEVDCSIKGKIRLIKIGNLVVAQYFQVDNATFNPTTEAQWVQIATIPQEYKPKYDVYFLDEGGNPNIGRYQIYANSNTIQFYHFGGQNYGWETAFNVMWITN